MDPDFSLPVSLCHQVTLWERTAGACLCALCGLLPPLLLPPPPVSPWLFMYSHNPCLPDTPPRACGAPCGRPLCTPAPQKVITAALCTSSPLCVVTAVPLPASPLQGPLHTPGPQPGPAPSVGPALFAPSPGPSTLPPLPGVLLPISASISVSLHLSVSLSPSQSLHLYLSPCFMVPLSLPPPFISGILFIAKAALQQHYRKCSEERSLLRAPRRAPGGRSPLAGSVLAAASRAPGDADPRGGGLSSTPSPHPPP